MAVFQFVNMIYFLGESVYFFTPSIWIIFVIILWEGLLGGGAYVNTYYRMSKEIPNNQKAFSIGVVALSDALGIALSGLVAIPAHNALCALSEYPRVQI